MEIIPKIPTDNLYKFYSIFGLVLFVFGIYLIYNSTIEKYKAQQELIRHEIVNRAIEYIENTNETDSLNFMSDSILSKFTPTDILGLNQDLQSDRKYIDLEVVNVYIIIIILVGLILGAYGFNRWYYKTQKFADQIIKNEALKISYEKEYEIYRLIWSSIIDLRNATLELRPFLDYIDKGKSEEEIKNERLAKHNEYYSKAAEIIEKHKPFYPISVFESIYEAMKLTKFEAIDYAHDDDDRKKAKEQIDSIIHHLDQICELIRNRLDEVKVI